MGPSKRSRLTWARSCRLPDPAQAGAFRVSKIESVGQILYIYPLVRIGPTLIIIFDFIRFGYLLFQVNLPRTLKIFLQSKYFTHSRG